MNNPTDFMLEKYKADRVHELELNKVQGTLEATALFGLVLLNGAAIVAYLSFLGNVWDKSRVPNMPWSFGAVFTWGVGVALGALTALAGLWCQSAFAQAYRARRQAEEWRRATEEVGLNEAQARDRLGLGHEENGAKLDEKANRLREEAGRWQSLSRRAAILGLVAFLLGVVFGLVAVGAASRPPGLAAADVLL